MKEVIGLWLMTLGVTIFLMFMDFSFTFREKVIRIICIMLFVTLIFLSAYFMAGGA